MNRVRVWRSLRVLDLQCNAVLGRPSSTILLHDSSPTDPNRTEVTPTDHRLLALEASFYLCAIFDLISQALTNTNTSLDENTAEGYLSKLRAWAQALPEELRQGMRREGRDGVPEWTHRERTIGNIHVACSYYFAVVLVTRPLIVATILPKLQELRGTTVGGKPSPPPPPSPAATGPGSRGEKARELSHAGIEAAMLLIQTCHDASTWDILLGNMCVLQ